MEATPAAPPLICPRCNAQGPGPRCAKDRAYMVTPQALREAQGDATLGAEIGGRYGVTERLGMGGMGAVYKAIDLKRGLTVAVKVLREAYAKHPAIRERFIREAEAGASLKHPNVVPLVDFGVEASGRLWLAMEYVQGWTLRDEINHNGAFSVRAAIELTRQVLKGLAVAHDAGMIHRDLKHDNIMYFGTRSSFTVRIVDFGVVKSEAADLMRASPQVTPKVAAQVAAQVASKGASKGVEKRAGEGVFELSADDFDLSGALAEAQAHAEGRAPAAPAAPAPAPASAVPALITEKDPTGGEGEGEGPGGEGGLAKELTAAGMMVGSPSYMAPEQIRGLKVGPPADLYALAVVVYEVLAARRLFTVNDYETLLREGAKRDAPLLVFSAKGELVPEPFAQMIHRALAHDPTDRYPDAHTMLLALDQMSLKVSALPVNLLSRLPGVEEGRGVRATGEGGAPARGALQGAASVGAGSVGAGSVGAASVGAGSVGAASVGAASVGAGSVGAGSVGAGSVGAGSVGAGSVGAASVGAGGGGAQGGGLAGAPQAQGVTARPRALGALWLLPLVAFLVTLISAYLLAR